MTARVAVAMAVYNDERYLPLALDALCAQGFRDFQVSIYDDGSTDRSADVATSFADRLPLQVVRGKHLGRHFAKQRSWAELAAAPYLLVLDSDIVLPPDALERMVERLDADPRAAAVSARYRAAGGPRLGGAQAFIDDVFFSTVAGAGGEGRWIVGACVLFRRAALEGVEVRADLSEDQDLSQKLRERWRLLLLPDLVATHLGVPASLGGVVRRFYREGVRVRALHRAYPSARQIGSLARLVPLPLCALLAAFVAVPAIGAVAAALLAAYLVAFLVASRGVPARLPDRLVGALLFTVGNLGFGAGYAREALRGRSEVMREPQRSS